MITQKDIKRAILEKDTTAAAVADKMGITPQNYANLTAKKFYTQADLLRIADALGVRYVSAFIDENGKTIAGGVCDPSELDGVEIKKRGRFAVKED